MIDLEYVTFMNNGKCFPTYKEAYFNGQFCGSKKVTYIFTPTWYECRNVGELEMAYRKYFNTVVGLDYFDLHTQKGCKQLNLMEIEK